PRNRVVFHDLFLTRPNPDRHLFHLIYGNIRIRSSGPGAAFAPDGAPAPAPWPVAPRPNGWRTAAVSTSGAHAPDRRFVAPRSNGWRTAAVSTSGAHAPDRRFVASRT